MLNARRKGRSMLTRGIALHSKSFHWKFNMKLITILDSGALRMKKEERLFVRCVLLNVARSWWCHNLRFVMWKSFSLDTITEILMKTRKMMRFFVDVNTLLMALGGCFMFGGVLWKSWRISNLEAGERKKGGLEGGVDIPSLRGGFDEKEKTNPKNSLHSFDMTACNSQLPSNHL